MFGQHASLKALKTRKQLLIVEAELQRQQAQADFEIIRTGVQYWEEQVHTAGAFLSSAGRAVTAAAEFKRKLGSDQNDRPGFFSRIATGARLASTVWRAFRADPKD